MEFVLEFVLRNIWLIMALPLGTALLIALLVGILPQRPNRLAAGLAIGSMGLAFLLSVIVFAAFSMIESPEAAVALRDAAAHGGGAHLKSAYDVLTALTTGSYRWATVGNFPLLISWRADTVTAMMLLVITLISLLIHVYSTGYLAEEAEEGSWPRYFASLQLFSFAMLGLVLADSFLFVFVCWELVGLGSYLLIGYWYHKPEAAYAAKKAFLVTRIGDLGFLIGIMILYKYTGQLTYVGVAAALAKVPAEVVTLAAILLFCGPIGKSAQFPLHVWLPDAMEGPTPVSALIHAATMVAAGVFFVGRVYFIYAASPAALTVVAWVGGFTAFLAASIALTQWDIKRVLAYSTVSQLGYMMMGLGLGPAAYGAGLFHLWNHAFFKAMLFLCAGSVILTATHHVNDMRVMGGLGKTMKITALCTLIGCLSIAGFPGFSGFWSKDEILAVAFHESFPLYLLGSVTAFLTTVYMFRLFFLTFTGEYRGQQAADEHHIHVHGQLHEPHHDSPLVMTLPLLILAVPSVLSGYVGDPYLAHNWFQHWLHQTYLPLPAVHEEAHGAIVPIVAILVTFAGIATAAMFYYEPVKRASAAALAAAMRPLYQLSFNKWYFDEAYLWFVDNVVLMYAWLENQFDMLFVDGLVNGVSFVTVASGEGAKYAQTGRSQHYLLVAVVGVIIIAGVLLVR